MVTNVDSGYATNKGLEKRAGEKSTLRSKEFIERYPIVDNLLKDERVAPIYNAFTAIVIVLVLQTAAYDYVYNGRINFGQRLILLGFGKIHIFWLLWIPVFLSTFIPYYCFKFWATVRSNLQPKSRAIKQWDYLWLGLTVAFYPGWLALITTQVAQQNILIVLKLAILMETTRMLMKIHAFIRSNAPRVLSYKPHTENTVLCPNLGQFMYFLWAPTLIYRDSYPRTKTIRWSYVGIKAIEFAVALVWISTTVETYFVRSFNRYGIDTFSWSDIVVMTISNAAGGMFMMISLVYILLSVWQPAFAEIFRFGDRQFNEDWWSSSNYERYYRTWNTLVHDWLHTYIYKDFYEIIAPGKKILAKYAVFFISAVFHEYVVGFSFDFFMPIIFIQFFIFGTVMTFVKSSSHTLGNVLLLFSLGVGNSINGTFLTIEFFARQNCPIENPTALSYLVPRLLSCGLKQ